MTMLTAKKLLLGATFTMSMLLTGIANAGGAFVPVGETYQNQSSIEKIQGGGCRQICVKEYQKLEPDVCISSELRPDGVKIWRITGLKNLVTIEFTKAKRMAIREKMLVATYEKKEMYSNYAEAVMVTEPPADYYRGFIKLKDITGEYSQLEGLACDMEEDGYEIIEFHSKWTTPERKLAIANFLASKTFE